MASSINAPDGWARYDDCPRCKAKRGTACVTFAPGREFRNPGPLSNPHKGRRKFAHVIPTHVSQLALLVHRVMASKSIRMPKLAKLTGVTTTTVSRDLNETKMPMHWTKAERYLAAMGMKPQCRAVPIDEERTE